MPLLAPAVIARLSCVFRFQRLIVVCVLILATAGIAAAQTITANGTSSAIAIFRGDAIAINASGLPHVRDWVGLYEVGAPSGYPFYRDWYYLNGLKSFPSSAIATAAFQFPVLEHSGQICRRPNGQNHQEYYYLYFGVGNSWSALPPDFGVCQSATPVAFAHSHTRPDSQYPSGFGSNSEYLDARPDMPNDPEPQRSDLWIADNVYDNPAYGPQAVRQSFWWYVTAPPGPNARQIFTRYKKTSISAAKDNVSQYDRSMKFWLPVPAPW